MALDSHCMLDMYSTVSSRNNKILLCECFVQKSLQISRKQREQVTAPKETMREALHASVLVQPSILGMLAQGAKMIKGLCG